jgi:glycosyltransferase involved in cell wall biosynthesis
MQKVTVILPVHNGANYLQSSIDSVLAQSHENFELHILDDGSTDASPDIAQSVKDHRVRYSRNAEKFGVFKTLNRGFAEAQTELVRTWAQDDLMLENSLEAFVRFAEQHPTAGMIYCDFYGIDAAGKRNGREQLQQETRKRTPEMANSRMSALLFFIFGCLPGNISTVMLRRQAWEKVGGFLEGRLHSSDYDLWVRVSEFFKIGFIREKLIELRDHPLQTSASNAKNLICIEEDLPVILRLQERLQGVLTEQEMMFHLCQHRGRGHAHLIARSLLRGEFNMAHKGWHALKQYKQPWQQMFTWLISANGRLFTTNQWQFFDKVVGAKKAMVN